MSNHFSAANLKSPGDDARMIFMVHGQATPQNVGPHDDLTAEFPFLGKPNP